MPLLDQALSCIDAANAEDRTGGALEYSRRMSAWLDRLRPDAPESLRLAARAQHIRRWQIPRNSYPMDRVGYLTWRTTLYKFHADQTAEILREVGYDETTLARVSALIRKEHLKTNPDAQTLEDVICLVFLENYFAEFASQHDPEKVIHILQRTWKKMSAQGHQHALQLQMSDPARDLVQRALG